MLRVGGALDAAGNPVAGYVPCGGRMLESECLCTFGLFATIPTLDDRTTMAREVFDWNRTMKTSFKSRLFAHGQRIAAPEFGLREKDILAIERLAIEPEGMIGRSSIAGQMIVASGDYVFVTLGSMTEGSSPGSMHAAPKFPGKCDGAAWTRWKTIAQGRPRFGKPACSFRSCGELRAARRF